MICGGQPVQPLRGQPRDPVGQKLGPGVHLWCGLADVSVSCHSRRGRCHHAVAGLTHGFSAQSIAADCSTSRQGWAVTAVARLVFVVSAYDYCCCPVGDRLLQRVKSCPKRRPCSLNLVVA